MTDRERAAAVHRGSKYNVHTLTDGERAAAVQRGSKYN